MTNWHLISLPHGWTECERYGNAIIAERDGRYCGFAVRYDTRKCDTIATCRTLIDNCINEGL